MDKIVEYMGNFIEADNTDFEGSLSFSIRAGYIEKRKLWKSKDLTAEFFGNFWKTILDIEEIKPTLHFICAELLENAVNHSLKSDYLIIIKLCFKQDELMVYVINSERSDKIPGFKKYINSLIETKDLQKLFIQKMKDAKKTGALKSQVGLITILKDRGAHLSWKFEKESDITRVTTLARIPLKKGKKHEHYK